MVVTWWIVACCAVLVNAVSVFLKVNHAIYLFACPEHIVTNRWMLCSMAIQKRRYTSASLKIPWIFIVACFALFLTLKVLNF